MAFAAPGSPPSHRTRRRHGAHRRHHDRQRDLPHTAHDAARRAGASEILEGEIIPLPEHRLELVLRRVDLKRGVLRGGYRIAGDDRIALFDSVTALLAADFGVPPPKGSLTRVSTISPIAYRLYEEGLRALFQADPQSAVRLFKAATQEDSTFAMAHYYLWRAEIVLDDPDHFKNR